MTEQAEIKAGGISLELPIITGSENEKAIDIATLRGKTGLVTLDPAFVNTAATTSAITFLDGEKGILRYRGIPIEQVAEKSNFLETSYLLIHGKLPTQSELERFEKLIADNAELPEGLTKVFDGFAKGAHPMAVLASSISALSSYYPDDVDIKNTADVELVVARLLSQIRSIAAHSFKKSKGEAFVAPRADLGYAGNFLNQMFGGADGQYTVDPEIEAAMNLLFILHADHEQNCSTSTVRLVGSSRANLFASIAAGVFALWGPLHGGANQEVIEMLERIQANGGDVAKHMELVKDKNSGVRLMGFGHRVYKNFDPRATIIKKTADTVLKKLGIDDPLLGIAKKLEETALKDEYFVARKLYPNVDFYSGIIYRALGFPTDMFTVLFAIGRLPGWIAHWKEMLEDKSTKIGRPRQIYTGATETDYTPIAERQ